MGKFRWRSIYLITGLVIGFLLTSVSCVLEISSDHMQLILRGTRWFAPEQDFVEEGHQVFISKQGTEGVTILASKPPSDKVFYVKFVNKKQDKIVIIDKAQDKLHPSEINTHIVLIKSSKNETIYTAHRAYIRNIDGQDSLEWDYYEAKPTLPYKNFFTAVTPTEYFQTAGKTETDGADSVQRRTYGFLAYLKDKVKDVSCLVTVFLPRWCERYDIPKIQPLSEEDEEEHKGTLDDEYQQEISSEEKVKSEKEKEQDESDEEEEEEDEGEDKGIGGTGHNHKIKKKSKKSKGKGNKNSKKKGRRKKLSVAEVHLKGLKKADKPTTGSDSEEEPEKNKEKVKPKKQSEISSKKKQANAKESLKGESSSEEELRVSDTKPGDKKKTKTEEDSGIKAGSSSSESEEEEAGKVKEHGPGEDEIKKNKSFLASKYHCPLGSGAILKANKCFCPLGTVLIRKRCLKKLSQIEEEEQDEQREPKTTTPPSYITKQLIFNNKKFRGADAGIGVDGDGDSLHKVAKTKREATLKNIDDKDNNVTSFEPDIVESRFLGPFYADLLKLHFDKDKAKILLGKLPRRSLGFFMDRYRLGNNKENGHPEFESKRLPFTGLMDCKYEDKKLKSFNGTMEETIVDYFLHTLRAQCHRKLRKHTLKLFKNGVIAVMKNTHSHVVVLNVQAEILNRVIYAKDDWQDFISAIFLAKFSQAFFEQKGLLEKKIQDNVSPGGQKISLTVRTLTVFVEKVMQLLKQKQFQKHAVKITKGLVMTITEYTQKIHKQDFIVTMFCKACRQEHAMFYEDLQQLALLSDYIMFGFPEILRQSLSFEEFYMTVVQEKVEK